VARALSVAAERRAAKAREQLAATDPAMAALIERIGPRSIADRMRGGSHFEDLARIVVGQQVSTAAAATIWGRVCDAFGGEPPTPEQVLGATDVLRGCGLSGRKATYMVGIGEAIVAGEFDPGELSELADDEVVAKLCALKGLGQWSAEMFLMFNLGRPDVFSGGDLGLRNGIRIVLELERAPGPQECVEIAARWSPQRTLASIYLWEAVHAELPGGRPSAGVK
jgi:3-methyladenine DNA glycosylase/8-oxoguanine DNA glycosylase